MWCNIIISFPLINMSFVNIPVGRTQDTADFRIGSVPDVNSLDASGSVVNQTIGFMTNDRIVANYEIAHMKDNLLQSLDKGHYLFTIDGSSRKSTTLLNLPLLNYALSQMQVSEPMSLHEVYKVVKPVGVLISEDSEWKDEPTRNPHLGQRQVVLGVSGFVTDVFNVWGPHVKTCTKLNFKLVKLKQSVCSRYKLHDHTF